MRCFELIPVPTKYSSMCIVWFSFETKHFDYELWMVRWLFSLAISMFLSAVNSLFRGSYLCSIFFFGFVLSLVCVYNWRLDEVPTENFTLAEYFKRLSSVQIINFITDTILDNHLLRYSSLTSQHWRLIKLVLLFTHNSSSNRYTHRGIQQPIHMLCVQSNAECEFQAQAIILNYSQAKTNYRLSAFFFFSRSVWWIYVHFHTHTQSHIYNTHTKTIDNSESGMKGKQHRNFLKWRKKLLSWNCSFSPPLFSIWFVQ